MIGALPHASLTGPENAAHVVENDEFLRDYIDGDVDPATDLTVVRFCRVRRAAAQAIASDLVGTKLVFDTEEYDTASMYDLGAANGRITAPVAGLYHFEAQIELVNNAAGIRRLYMTHSAGTVPAASPDKHSCSGAVTALLHLSCDLVMAAAAYVEFYAIQNSGGALNTAGGANTWASGRYVGRVA